MYLGKSVCADIALEIGGDNATGRIKLCPKCGARYYSVETLEKKKVKKENVWD